MAFVLEESTLIARRKQTRTWRHTIFGSIDARCTLSALFFVSEVYLLNDLVCRGHSSQYGVWSKCAQNTWVTLIQKHFKGREFMQAIACSVWSLHFWGKWIISENFMGMVFKLFFLRFLDQTNENKTQRNPFTDRAKPEHPQIIAGGQDIYLFFSSKWTPGDSFANVSFASLSHVN